MRNVKLVCFAVLLGMALLACKDGSLAPLPESLYVLSRTPLSFDAVHKRPLAFYPRILVANAHDFYLQAVRGGIYPSDYDGLYAFDRTGRCSASLTQAPAWARGAGVILLVGIQGDEVLVTSRGLQEDEPTPDSPKTYRLDRSLRVLAALGSATPGLLGEDGEVFTPGVTRTAPGSSECRCVRVTDLSGNQIRSFGECPAGSQDFFVQQVELALAPARVYWMHFREAKLHVCTPDGVELGVIDHKPIGYVSLEDARQRLGNDTDPRHLLEAMTLVQCVAVSGRRILVSYRAHNDNYPEFWRFDSIVDVLDADAMIPLFSFRTPLRLLGSDSSGVVYWLESLPVPDGATHTIVRTELR